MNAQIDGSRYLVVDLSGPKLNQSKHPPKSEALKALVSVAHESVLVRGLENRGAWSLISYVSKDLAKRECRFQSLLQAHKAHGRHDSHEVLNAMHFGRRENPYRKVDDERSLAWP